MNRIQYITYTILVCLIFFSTTLLYAQQRYGKIPRVRIESEKNSNYCKSTDVEVKLFQPPSTESIDHEWMASNPVEVKEQLIELSVENNDMEEMQDVVMPNDGSTVKLPVDLKQHLWKAKRLHSAKSSSPKSTKMDFDELFMVGWIAAGAFVTFAAAAVINFIIGGFSIIVIAMIIAAGVFFLAAVIFFILAYTIGEEDYF